MSDVDRLREAADRLDEWAVEYHRRGGGPLTLVDAWEKQSALLRVALLHVDEHVCPYPYAPHGNNTWVGIAQTDFGGDLDPCPVLVAALALADTVLGDGEHQHRWRGVVDGSEYCVVCNKSRWAISDE